MSLAFVLSLKQGAEQRMRDIFDRENVLSVNALAETLGEFTQAKIHVYVLTRPETSFFYEDNSIIWIYTNSQTAESSAALLCVCVNLGNNAQQPSHAV